VKSRDIRDDAACEILNALVDVEIKRGDVPYVVRLMHAMEFRLRWDMDKGRFEPGLAIGRRVGRVN